jgi:DNA-binding protein HU-beta
VPVVDPDDSVFLLWRKNRHGEDTVNKAELIEALAQHYDGNKAEASKALNAVVQTITYAAASGNKVAITGFGVFEKVDRPARLVRNPRTGERKEAAATSVPRFRPGTELKAYVSGEREVPASVPTISVPATAPTRRAASRNGSAEAVAVTADPAPQAAAEVEPAQAGGAKKKDSKKSSKKAESLKKGKPDKKKKDGKKAKSVK